MDVDTPGSSSMQPTENAPLLHLWKETRAHSGTIAIGHWFCKKRFSCSTRSMSICHVTRKKNERRDAARLPNPRQSSLVAKRTTVLVIRMCSSGEFVAELVDLRPLSFGNEAIGAVIFSVPPRGTISVNCAKWAQPIVLLTAIQLATCYLQSTILALNRKVDRKYGAPSVSEVSECISLLKRHRAAGPDDLPHALSKDGGSLSWKTVMTSATAFAGDGFHTSLPSRRLTIPGSFSPFTWLCEKSPSGKSVDWHTKHMTKLTQVDRWTQYFEQQFSWPPAAPNPESWPSTERWTMNVMVVRQWSTCVNTDVADDDDERMLCNCERGTEAVISCPTQEALIGTVFNRCKAALTTLFNCEFSCQESSVKKHNHPLVGRKKHSKEAFLGDPYFENHPVQAGSAQKKSFLSASRIADRCTFLHNNPESYGEYRRVLLKRRDFSLFIHPVLFEDAGEYRCAITLRNNVYIRTVTLKVLLPPKITRSPVSFLKVDEGASLEITCAAKGYPNPQTKWFVSKRSPNMFARLDQRNQTFHDLIPVTEKFSDFAGQILSLNGTLWITKLHRNMNGYLVCVAQNGVPPDDTTTLELSVRFPPDIQMANRVIKQSLGMNTVLSCTVFANPPGTVQWYFNQKTRIIASSCDILSNEEKKHCLLEHRPHPNNVLAPIISKLTIFKLNAADFGDYTCSVSNIMGERYGTTSLQIMSDSIRIVFCTLTAENLTAESQQISATKPVPVLFTKASVQKKMGQVKNLAWKQHNGYEYQNGRNIEISEWTLSADRHSYEIDTTINRLREYFDKYTHSHNNLLFTEDSPRTQICSAIDKQNSKIKRRRTSFKHLRDANCTEVT
ncbi:opioid-binding protein/cell adhesion molecule [Clonorchis sinensis]|uniref:Opioid-binding protein/cell adhesion molecule n=1 Tax=Clonorchis sinensis TaxID=79923 RepID=G7Y541_CLOSI|nr:opioid-binding protein/cell adhesion molecule [Clonorchis sinensis]